MSGVKRMPGDRIYEKRGRWYGDFRDYSDVGGRREALTPPGASRATDDRALAIALVLKRLDDLKCLRRRGAQQGEGRGGVRLGELAVTFIADERRRIDEGDESAPTQKWLDATAQYLERAVAHFGAAADLMDITPPQVLEWISVLAKQLKGIGGPLSGSAKRKHMYALSKLYDFGNLMSYLPTPYNPIRLIPRKRRPKEASREARFLEVAEAARLLEACRSIEPSRSDACPFLHELVATYLLTGGRKTEVLGLEVDDVSFDRQTITFRGNQWRRLKTRKSARVVKLWPQLEGILRPLIFPADRTPRVGLLFPGEGRGGEVQMVTDFRKALAPAVKAAKLKGEVTPKVFRHTYTAARLQTLDAGQPVSPYTVSGELGHGSLAMVEQVYGHLGEVRHRSEVVEYRVSEVSGDKPVVTGDVSGDRKSLQRS